MLPAVDFDNQSVIAANEIDDVWADGRLPLKFVSAETMGAQKIPKPLLRIGHARAKLLG